MIDDPLIARLAAANPAPTDAPAPKVAPRSRPRRATLLLAICAALAVPAVAFAHDIGSILGIANKGTPVSASSIPQEHYAEVRQMMRRHGFSSTVRLLGTRDGVSFYAAEKSGRSCFAISAAITIVGCAAGKHPFPSAQQPVLMLPGPSFAGLAADGVASVAALNAAGKVLAKVPVRDNLFAAGSRSRLPGLPARYATIEAFNARGEVISRHVAKLTDVSLASGLGELRSLMRSLRTHRHQRSVRARLHHRDFEWR